MIPLAPAGGAGGRIAHIRADGVKPINDAKLIPEIALLNDCRLYHAGDAARTAIRELDLGSDGILARLKRTRRAAYLSPMNAPDLRSLSPNNSASAQFGLALASLMYQCQSKAQIAIATGELVTDKSLFQAAASTSDAAVKPVGLMGEKLETIRAHLDDYVGGALAPWVPFFFPTRTPDGEDTLALYKPEFERLVAAYRDRGVDLTLHPVSSLREALPVLGIKGPGLDSLYKLLLAALALMAVFLVFAGAFHLWLARPIELAFGGIVLATNERLASPFPVGRSSDGAMETLTACSDFAGRPVYPTDAAIAFRAVVANPSTWTDWFGPYHFAVLTVSDKSGAKVFAPAMWGGSSGGEREVSARLSIKDAEESNKLVILARRGKPFDTEALRSRLSAIIANTAPPDRINAVVNAVVGDAPGYLDYSFLTAKGQSKCLQEDSSRR